MLKINPPGHTSNLTPSTYLATATLSTFVALVTAPSANAGADDTPEAVSFTVVDGNVIPEDEFAVKVTIIGCSWMDIYGTLGPVSLQVNVGGEIFDPFGDATDHTAGNVNTGSPEPRHLIIQKMFDDQVVSVTARGWQLADLASGPSVLNSHDNTEAVMVLRDGDPVPNISAMASQAKVEIYLQSYTDASGAFIRLHDNQAIYLFELNNLALDPAEYLDYQDVVALITIGSSIEDLEDEPYPPLSTVDPLFD